MRVYEISNGDRCIGVVRTAVELQLLLQQQRVDGRRPVGYSIHGDFRGQTYSGEVSVEDLTVLATVAR